MLYCDAVASLVANYEISASLISADEDEATYEPSLSGLTVLTALTGRQVSEQDLHFVTGGAKKPYYVAKQALIEEIRKRTGSLA